MTEEQIRKIIQDELARMFGTDRTAFNFQKDIRVSLPQGVKIATKATQKLGFWGATPVVQQSSTGELVGCSPGNAYALYRNATFTGNLGSTAYTIGDIVKHLKTIGIILT